MPKSGYGSKYPKHEKRYCFGKSFSEIEIRGIIDLQLNLEHLFEVQKELNTLELDFFNDNNFFEKLAGTDQTRSSIIAGKSFKSLEATWEQQLEDFKSMREEYLLYP